MDEETTYQRKKNQLTSVEFLGIVLGLYRIKLSNPVIQFKSEIIVQIALPYLWLREDSFSCYQQRKQKTPVLGVQT